MPPSSESEESEAEEEDEEPEELEELLPEELLLLEEELIVDGQWITPKCLQDDQRLERMQRRSLAG